MDQRIPLIVAGVIFSLVALLHLLRLVNQWQVMIGGQMIPMSLSVMGLIITVVLAIWMFIAASNE